MDASFSDSESKNLLEASRRLLPRLWLEGGLGLSNEGPKLGLRGRFDLLPDATVTPFLAAGLLYGFGAHLGNANSPYEFDVLPSPFAQAVAGLSVAGENLTIAFAGGWAWLLRRNNFTHFQDHGDKGAPFDFLGEPHTAAGGGIAMELTIGRRF